MRDAQGNEIRRGDRILDANGDVFMVRDVGPVIMHVQNVKTGRRYTVGIPAFLRLPPAQRFGKPEMNTQKKRAYYFNKHVGGRRR